MKSVFRTRYGPPDVLEVKEVPTPEPRPGELLVRVHAATVSRTDCGGLWGAPFVYRFFAGFPRPRHVATGCDFAGEVAALGKDVTTFQVGDRVWGFDDTGAGTHAQYATFAANKAIDDPGGISTTRRPPPPRKGRTTPSTSCARSPPNPGGARW